MSMTWKEAKAYVKEHGGDWRDQWKYGDKVRGVGRCADAPCFEWGINITDQEKKVVSAVMTNPSKWAKRVEDLFDNPPDAQEIKIFKVLKRLGKL